MQIVNLKFIFFKAQNNSLWTCDLFEVKYSEDERIVACKFRFSKLLSLRDGVLKKNIKFQSAFCRSKKSHERAVLNRLRSGPCT